MSINFDDFKEALNEAVSAIISLKEEAQSIQSEMESRRMDSVSKLQETPTSFKRRHHYRIWIVIRWDIGGNFQIVHAYRSYGLAELVVLGTLDDYTYTIEECYL